MDIERDPAELRRAFLQVGTVLVGVYVFLWGISSLLSLMPSTEYLG